MFNVTILKIKDIVRILIGITLTVIVVIVISKKISNNTNQEDKIVKKVKAGVSILSETNMVSSMEQTMPKIADIEEKKSEKKETKTNLWRILLNTQMSSVQSIEEIENNSLAKKENEEIEQVNQEEEQSNSNNQTQMAKTGLSTEVITKNPIADKSNVQYGNIKIKNETDYALTEDVLKPDITIENKNIILFHTHSCESYTASEKYQYTPTGNFRTTDMNFNVTKVGSELESQLKQYNYNVIHNTDYHDYPAYNGSYTRSLATVENILTTNPADIIFDIHRDAIGSRSDYAPTVKIGDVDEAAQIMFVVGTNNGGLWHPNWNQNLKFAVKVQQKAEEMYPRVI